MGDRFREMITRTQLTNGINNRRRNSPGTGINDFRLFRGDGNIFFLGVMVD